MTLAKKKKENTTKYFMLMVRSTSYFKSLWFHVSRVDGKFCKNCLSNKLHDKKNTQQRRNDVQRRKEIRSGKKHRGCEGEGERKKNLTVTCRMEVI